MRIHEPSVRWIPWVESINHQSGHEKEHSKAQQETGFYGRAAAGCIFLAKNTSRFCIVRRSSQVQHRGTWGTIGGAINPGEDPKTATMREAEEEVGYTYHQGDNLVLLDTFASGDFRYTTFLYIIENEFQARLNWEATNFGWFELNRLPAPLHFGLAATLSKPQCIAIIQKELATRPLTFATI